MSDHDDQGAPPNDNPRGILPIIALDSTNLRELFLWSRIAHAMLTTHGDEAKTVAQAVLSPNTSFVLTDADMNVTTQRLEVFLTSIGEIIESIRVGQAQIELAGLDRSKLQ